jgi:signal transduction histidine kinase
MYHRAADRHLILSDDDRIVHADLRVTDATADNTQMGTEAMSHTDHDRGSETSCEYRFDPPREAASSDIDVLRSALIRESMQRRRAECSAYMQTEVVQLALDLLVREPDLEGFFGGLAKTMVEESESHTCGVYLLDEAREHNALWLAYVKDRLFMPAKSAGPECSAGGPGRFPCETMAAHLFDYKPGWEKTIEYEAGDSRLPEAIRAFGVQMKWQVTVATPLRIGNRMLGWMTVCSLTPSPQERSWGRVMLIEAIARQAALALHHSRVVDQHRLEERRKAILEERNRLARDIHDNLAQGFAAILMQLQAAQRESAMLPASQSSIAVAIDLARTHLAEARRSVSALRPNVGSGEDLATVLKRIIELNRRTTAVPIDLELDPLPRFGDSIEREIAAIAQEALTNAVRHSRADRITVKASIGQSMGLRLSVADDGRGIPREPSTGFGMTSMQERADRIGASLTIVTAPRNGTEVVLAWDPTTLPTQVHGNA